MNIGDRLPELTLPPISRTALTLFAGASGGRSAVQIGADHADKTGLPNVIAYDMLSMAYLARFLTARFDQSRLRHFEVHFVGVTLLEDQTSCSGEVIELFDAGCERRARLAIRAANGSGERMVVGEVVVSL